MRMRSMGMATLVAVVTACGLGSETGENARSARPSTTERGGAELHGDNGQETTTRQDGGADPGSGTGVDAGASEATDGGSDGDAGVAVDNTLEAGRWNWADIDGAKCADGTPTGVGVNAAQDSQELLLFLQGGGACWSGESCWGPVSTSFYIRTGYNQIAFATDVMRPALLPLRRFDPFNPFRNMNMVYVPYCTGDVHAGDKVTTYEYLGQRYETHHVGYRNVGLVLEYIARNFPNTRRIIIAGDSAGGFGSALNLDRVQQRFPSLRVDVIDDSGQPIEPGEGRWAEWKEAWNLQVPADCTDCSTDVGGFVRYYQQKYPQHRFGLISYTHDSVISTFMGLSPLTFHDRLRSLGDGLEESWPTAHYYFLPGALHVGFATPTPGLIRWLKQFVEDDPEWSSHSLL